MPKRKYLTPFTLSFAVTLLLGSATACKAENTTPQSLERTLSVSGPVQLKVSSNDGDIHIRAGADGQVSVVGKLSSNYDVNIFGFHLHHDTGNSIPALPITQHGNQIEVGPLENTFNTSISYWITVPRGTSVVADSSSGDLDIAGVDGSLAGQTTSGDVHAQQINGPVSIHDTSGDVNLSIDQSPSVEVEVTSGDIDLQNIHNRLTVENISGDTAISGAPEQDWDVKNISGDITLKLQNAGPFQLNAHTDSGSIHSDHVSGNGPTVRLDTASGDITVHESRRAAD